ncbi:S8 family serine peptidase [Nonomuraea glycinis]|uniref:S8 family serine peptidase n=1 Tax=Nonomuraea glycinis TaxID=2047744 RepID=UPI0033A7D0FD
MLNTPRWRVLLLGAATTLSLVLPYGVAHAAPEPDKISPAVQQQLDSADKATFWVRVKGGADLTAARRASSKEVKAERVYEAKTDHAESSQAGLRTMLKAHDVDFTPYWIVNAIKVTANAKVAAAIAERPEVERIEPVRTLSVPKPEQGKAENKVNANEWNIDRVGAPRVWDELGNRGEGVVVANIDTGVQFDHPDLQANYRGHNPDGSVSHAYNWFDPAQICPTSAPCDNNGHGTHTMGTMVGANGIGVAPGAQWIAAKGCEANSCSDASLLSAGQWILAPTDAAGANPRPDLAPDIVNNSWGGAGFDPWYKETVEAWVAAGIFPAFSNGNEGPSCTSSGSPGQYVTSYSAGGFDINNALYARSSKGAGENGEIKPNIAAPGVNVRSSVPGGYASFTGTSMASPHVAATVALIWSASPSLNGDIEATRPLLDVTAIDVADTACGGTAADNNIWGEGRLDTFAAVQAAPQEEVGELKGVVTADGAPVAGVTVTITGPTGRTVVTGADGAYTFVRLVPGQYEIRAAKFGYATASATATVVAEQSATADVTLTPLASGVVSGTVTTAGTAEAGARILAGGTPLSAVTDAGGRYRLTLPYGDYELSVVPASRCSGGDTASVTVGGDLTKDFDLPLRGDNFGYTCAGGTEPYVAGTDKLALTGDDEAAQVTLPFAIPFYGANETRAWIATNGFASFAADRSTAAGNGTLPTAATPNHAVYPFWDDLVVDDQGGIYTGVVGTAPRRQYVIEWRNVRFFSDSTQRISFSALLGEDGSVSYRYKDIESERDQGAFATVGIENRAGTDALLYSLNEPVVSTGQSLTFTASQHGLVTGVVTDANDGEPLPGATVKIGEVGTFTTGADGRFSGQVLAGDYEVEVAKEHYGTFTKPVTVAPGTLTAVDTALVTGRVAASVAEVTVVAPSGASRTRTLELTNLGSATPYTVSTESADWLKVAPGSGTLAKNQKTTLKITVSSNGVTAGTVRAGKLLIRSASGRQPVIEIAVKVVVPKHQVAVEVGGGRRVTDGAGDSWDLDKKYQTGGYGYVANSSSTGSTNKTIKGTDDQSLFRTAREGMLEYRFDRVPNGVYTVELDFADIENTRPGRRVFDVLVEGELAIPALDLALEAGTYTAVSRQYTVRVSDGQLNVRFATREGSTLVNAIRISERPDKAAS